MSWRIPIFEGIAQRSKCLKDRRNSCNFWQQSLFPLKKKGTIDGGAVRVTVIMRIWVNIQNVVRSYTAYQSGSSRLSFKFHNLISRLQYQALSLSCLVGLSPIRQLLVTAKTEVPLLQCEEYLTVLVSAEVHRNDSLVHKYYRVLIAFLPRQLTELLPALGKLILREQNFRSVLA